VSRRLELRVLPRPTATPTQVIVGAGLLEGLARAQREAFPRARRFLVFVDERLLSDEVDAAWGSRRLVGSGAVALPEGERSKTREVHAFLEDRILDAGITRDDAVVAIGGGAVLDAVGYGAATARRGVPWIAVPTSVVAIADASIGGKTAINHARGKNLLGAFHAPGLVLADVATLSTLPRRDFVAGLAEVWKAGVVGDPTILKALRDGPPESDDALEECLCAAIRVKARLVEEDERDEGVRRALNYGHTVGHALETVLGPDAVRHGEAVAIGMGVAAQIACRRGLVDAAFTARQDADLERLALPTRVPASADGRRVREAIGADKKRRAGATHTWVLPLAAGGVRIVEDVTDDEIDAALDARSARR